MTNRRAIATAALVVIAIGFIVVLTLRGFDAGPEHAGSSGPPTAPAPDPVVAVDPALDAAGASNAAPPQDTAPPWLAKDIPADAPGPGQPAADAERQRQLRDLQASMRGVMAASAQRSAETYRHLSDALDTLEAMDDPAVTAQIDLDAVRHNLEISMRMQAAAQKLQRITAEPRSAERQQRMDAVVAELRSLQSQLRADVRAPGSTLPESLVLPPAR